MLHRHLIFSFVYGNYIYMYWYSTSCLYLFTYQVYFKVGAMYIIRARFTAVYAYNMCDYSGMYVD